MGFNNELIRSLGMTLVHSLWEGLAILALILFCMSFAGKSNARLKYILLVSGLLLLVTGFFTTWFILYNRLAISAGAVKKIYNYMPQMLNSGAWIRDTYGFPHSLQHFLEPFYPYMALGWLLGFFIMAARMTGGLYLSYKLIIRDVFLPEDSLAALFEKVRIKMGISGILRFRLSTRMISPMVIGILKPCVIVPAAILSGLNTEQVEAILVHELAHIRRYDHLVLVIQALATQILFFHPVAWYLWAEINRERENCCDDIVINNFPNPINYIKALTMIQEFNMSGPVPANALTGRSKRLLGRVKRLLKTDTGNAPVFKLAIVSIILITLGIAAITLASAGNAINKPGIAAIFFTRPQNKEAVQDTIKNKQALKREDQKKKKEMEEARQKLEKAQLELKKANEQLELARQKVEEAKEKMRDQDLASGDAMHASMDEARLKEFKMEQDERMQERMKDMNEHLARMQEEIQRRMQMFKQEDWEKFKDQWQKSGAEMKKAMEDFYRSRKDSGSFFNGPHFFDMRPFPPCPPVPPVPPLSGMDIPDVPGIEAIPSDESQPENLIQQDQDDNNKKKAELLNSKLREAERTSENAK